MTKSIKHPDQAIFDGLAKWIDLDQQMAVISKQLDAIPLVNDVMTPEYRKLEKRYDRLATQRCNILDDVILSPEAQTPEGIAAQLDAAERDGFMEDSPTYPERQPAFLRVVRNIRARFLDRRAQELALFDLCRRCVEALAANDAIYEAVPKGVDISDEVSDAASAHYDAEVVPLLKQIEATPTTTLAGFVAKARVFMHDGVDLHGEDDICNACAVMLNDLSGLDLVPEVPEAPHHYEVVRSSSKLAATQQEAA